MHRVSYKRAAHVQPKTERDAVFPQNNNSMQKLRCHKSLDAKPSVAGGAASASAAPPPGPDPAPWPDPPPGAEQWPDPARDPAKHTAQDPAKDPAQDPAHDPAPHAPPPATAPESPAGPCPEQSSLPWARQLRSKKAAPAADRKRRKTDVDLDASFRAVEAALAQDAPPLMHTPQSLMRMLLDVFELEFPDRLPRPAVAQVLQAIK
jgi:hypothetical protein